MFSLESPHRGDSNENTAYTIFNINTKSHPKISEICSYEISPRDPRTSSNEFETAVVNESSVFEPLNFYCIKVSEDGGAENFSIVPCLFR